MAGILEVREVFGTTDTGVDLWWTLSIPDDGEQHPIVPFWHAGGYRGGEYDVRGGLIRTSLAQTGQLIGAACEYRLAPAGKEMNTSDGLNGFQKGHHESPGQDTVNDTGHGFPTPKQTNDCTMAILAARNHERCNGLVYTLGGSAGGGHSMFMAFYHAEATDGSRPDLAAACSGASLDLADLDFLMATCTSGQTCPHFACANYAGVEDTYPNPFPADSIEIFRVLSPATYVTSKACPVFLTRAIPLAGGNNDPDAGDSLGIDITMNRLIEVMQSKGIVESFATVPEAGSFKQKLIESQIHAHAFNHWQTRPPDIPQGAADFIIPWFLAGPPTDSNPPPPPEDDPYPTIGWLTSQSPGATGTVPPIRSTDTTCQLTNLTSGAQYTFHLKRQNAFGFSKETPKIFTEDPPDNGGGGGGRTRKHSPGGLYALFDQTNGSLPTGWQDQDVWRDRSVNGVRFRTDWTVVQATADGGYDFSSIDTFLAYAALQRKGCGLSVEPGIRTPDWVFDLSGLDSWVFADSPDPGTIPVIWNPKFIQTYGFLIQALGTKYDAHPELDYIVAGGLGRTLESLLALSAGDLALVDAQATADGYANANAGFVDAVSRIARAWGTAFPTTPVIIPMIAPFPGAPRDPTGDEALVDMCTALFGVFPPASRQKPIGLMYEHGDEDTNSIDDEEAQLIFQNAAIHPTGYRFDATTGAADVDLFDQILTNLEGFGAEFIEIWSDDANTQDADYLAARIDHNAILKQAAGKGASAAGARS